jgi:hypothetical protein
MAVFKEDSEESIQSRMVLRIGINVWACGQQGLSRQWMDEAFKPSNGAAVQVVQTVQGVWGNGWCLRLPMQSNNIKVALFYTFLWLLFALTMLGDEQT